MNPKEVAKALSALTLAQYRPAKETFSVYVPDLEDQITLPFHSIEDACILPAPTGGLATDFSVRLDGALRRVLITDHDIVFPPSASTSVLASRMRFKVSNAPDLVAYTEMERDAEQIAAGCARPGSVDIAGMSGALLLMRCFLAGALRVGARPRKTMRFWQRAWQLKGELAMLPPFRSDPAWDALATESLSED